MRYLVHIKADRDPEGFFEEALNLGLRPYALNSMPRSIVTFVDEGEFPLGNHPDIDEVLADDTEAGIPEDILIEELGSSTGLTAGGNWGKVRLTHPVTPWRVKGMRFPFSVEYTIPYREGWGVDVYNVDTGVRESHEEFDGRVTTIDGFTTLSHFHGTACMGLLAGESTGLARGANCYGTAGLRNANGSGATVDINTAMSDVLTHYLDQAPYNRPALLSMSLSSSSESAFRASVTSLTEAGLVIFAAAGNDRVDLDIPSNGVYPAMNTRAICVGGSNIGDFLYDTGGGGTNYGSPVQFLGPSERLRHATFEGDDVYALGNGTSYGTPLVAGVLACMLQDYQRHDANANPSHRALAALQMVSRAAVDTRRYPKMTKMLPYLNPAKEVTHINGWPRRDFDAREGQIVSQAGYAVVGGEGGVQYATSSFFDLSHRSFINAPTYSATHFDAAYSQQGIMARGGAGDNNILRLAIEPGKRSSECWAHYRLRANSGNTATLRVPLAFYCDGVLMATSSNMSTYFTVTLKGATTDVTSGSIPMEAGTTAHPTETVDAQLLVTETTSTLNIYINGVLIRSIHQPQRAPSPSPQISTVHIRPQAHRGSAHRARISEIIIASASTIGSRLYKLRAAAAPGTYDEIPNLALAHNPSNPIQHIGVGQETLKGSVRFETPTVPMPTITAVVVNTVLQQGKWFRRAQPFVRIGDVDHMVGDEIAVRAQTRQSVVLPVNPTTNAAWTLADMSNLEIGIEAFADVPETILPSEEPL